MAYVVNRIEIESQKLALTEVDSPGDIKQILWKGRVVGTVSVQPGRLYGKLKREIAQNIVSQSLMLLSRSSRSK